MADRLTNSIGLPVSGTTAQRPANAEQGVTYYDTTLGMMVVYNDGSGTGTPTAGFNPVAGIHAEMVTFTETSGAGTYTGAVSLPAGATLLDIIIDGVALWGASSSAALIVGDDSDSDGFYASTNLKATDLLAGESLSFAQSGGKAGAYQTGTGTHWASRYSASARTITGTVTTVGTGGTTGRTRMTVVYCLPRVKAATKA